MTPELAMQEALRQADRALGKTCPNPAVGAVVYRGDRVLGEGYTRPPGGPHAEVVALRAAVRKVGRRGLRGTSLAVTLEPCNHSGRTGPCTDAILEAGLGSIAVGMQDPNPKVAGRGLRRLRNAGIRVRNRVLEDEVREQLAGYRSVHERGRPWVALKLAASLDGRIATARGSSRWISGEAARARVHELRSRSDAIAVGSETARLDDPALTARAGRRIIHRPIRVLVDSRLRVPATAQMFRTGEADRTWVLTGEDAPVRKRRSLEARGVRVLGVGKRKGGIDLRQALRRLAREGLTQVLVEGGGVLAAALLRNRLVDEIHWFSAPILLGGDARPALGDLGVVRIPGAPGLEVRSVESLGRDLYLRARVTGARGKR